MPAVTCYRYGHQTVYKVLADDGTLNRAVIAESFTFDAWGQLPRAHFLRARCLPPWDVSHTITGRTAQD